MGENMNDVRQNTWRNFFLSHTFSFGREESIQPYTKNFNFCSDGLISGYDQDNETYWHLLDNKLLIENNEHVVTTEFILPTSFEFGLDASITGTFLLNPLVKHTLISIYEKKIPHKTITSDNDLELSVNRAMDLVQRYQSFLINSQKNNDSVHLAFIINSVETLPALLPLINSTLKDHRFEVKIIILNKYFGLDSLNTIEPLRVFLDHHRISYIKVLKNFDAALNSLINWNPDFIVRQSEWDLDFPVAFSATNLSFTRLIYIPYVITENFIQSPKEKNGSLLTNPYYENIWRYFIPEELPNSLISNIKHSFISEEIFNVVGSMKAIQIKKAIPKWPIPHSKNYKVVWIAHHSIGINWFNMGIFPNIYKFALSWIKSHPNIDVVFNPHPLLRESIQNKESPNISITDYNLFLDELSKLPNALIFEGYNQYSLTAAADVILTDGISSIYEMQIQRKKIISIIRSDHVPFTERGKELLLGTNLISGNKPNQAFDLIEHLLTHENEKEEQENQNINMWLKNEHPETEIIQKMISEFKK